MKRQQFIGSAVDQLELGYSYLLTHQGHSLRFSLINLDTASIQCSTCNCVVLQGSREFLECVYGQYSMNKSDP